MSNKKDIKQEKETLSQEQELNEPKDQKETAENLSENTDNKSEETKEETEKIAEETKVEEPIDELAGMTKKYTEMNDKYLRLSAEFDNYRKRTLKERMELIKSAGEDILINILPVKDNFERALVSLETAKDPKAIKEGIELIYTNLVDFLSQRGIKEIEAKEKEFDTDLHEAVTKIPAPSKKLKGKNIDVIEKGYLLHEKVIRFAKVVVGE